VRGTNGDLWICAGFDWRPEHGPPAARKSTRIGCTLVLRNLVHAPYIMRELPALVSAAGFCVQSLEPHGYVQTTSPDYLLMLLSRGVTAAGRAGPDREGQTAITIRGMKDYRSREQWLIDPTLMTRPTGANAPKRRALLPMI
jgi:hypothetical protein